MGEHCITLVIFSLHAILCLSLNDVPFVVLRVVVFRGHDKQHSTMFDLMALDVQ